MAVAVCAEDACEVPKNDMDIVKPIRDRLADRVGHERFDLWFGPNVQLRYANATLYVQAPDTFTVERLRRQMRGEIVAATEDVLGSGVSVAFEVRESAASPTSTSDHTPADHTPASEPQTPPVDSQQTPNTSTVASMPRVAIGTGGPQLAAPSPASAAAQAGKRDLNNFVVGECNRLAWTAARQVPQRLGVVSPVFLHGPTGSGKTHLLEGITTATRRLPGRKRIVNLSAERFTSYFLEALKGSGLPSFRRKYRDVDLLLIDDVQFFVGKRATLVELQHTMDAMLRQGNQIVLTADRPPAELRGLGLEITARMTGGLVCNIDPADEATRLGILQQVAMQRGVDASDDVLQMIAGQLHGDARQLVGALNRLQAASEALEQPITLPMAESALTDIFQATRRVVRLADINEAVSELFQLEPDALQSNRKARTIAQPRMLAMWLARDLTRAAYSEIGEFFGDRTHSTVISAKNKVNRWIQDETAIQLATGTYSVKEVVRRVQVKLRRG
ncbi:MAG TPA: chromosomal replication initiator protein DnaA [Planctomycetaceae bacterium]|nr:chromosomal replication initiator protein DnaA [Blastopirellula sp.]HAY82268.1 chromosomal replication initiator protein DnaA [Planctomycetaceae bacterium]